MNKLSVIKASAGSGKTHTLTWNVLQLLFTHESPDYFKHILAVTFTNKATEEMKTRFISELSKLAAGERSDYYSRLVKFKFQDGEIREKATKILVQILHEYSWFSIETIDSFFQRVIRAFTRELGLPGNYRIELDTDMILEYAIDQLIDTLGEDEEILAWLVSFSEEKIAEGKSWDIRNDLLQLGRELFKEHFSTHATVLMDLFLDREKIKVFRNELQKIRLNFERKCASIGKKAVALIDENGLADQDFYSKRNGAGKIFRMLAACELKTSKKELFTSLTIMDRLLEDPKNWPADDTPDKELVIRLAEESLLPLLKEAVSLTESEYIVYETAITMMRNLYAMGILVDISKKIREYRLENNIFILNDSPVLIDRIINHNDTPFIYEKMGTRYRHFLIDEFQDTSLLQWKNFKPLIKNALDQNSQCVLVGDAKQSIYRWRNGEWEILARQIFEEFSENALTVYPLNTNWRSRENIVKFNSAFFSEATDVLLQALNSKIDPQHFALEGGIELLKEVYSDVVQEMPDKFAGEKRGNIALRFYTTNEVRNDKRYFHSALTNSLNELLSLDYQLNDIAIIVRDKNQGERIVEYLMDGIKENKFVRPVRFVSEESLLLSSSQAVNLLIASLRYILYPDELLYQAELLSTFEMLHSEKQEDPLSWNRFLREPLYFASRIPKPFTEHLREIKVLPFYEMVEKLISIFELNKLTSDTAYLHAFLNMIYDFVHTEQGSLQGFLKFWEQRGKQKSIPASQSQDAIRILTIHKSKGLEYEAVILPFCDWNFDQKANHIFWADVPDFFMGQVPVFPINYASGLKYTYFARAYNHELFRSYVDNLNLLYVAMTRAKESLIAFPVFKESEDIKTVGDLLYSIIQNGKDDFLKGHYSPDEQLFRIGFDRAHARERKDSDRAEHSLISDTSGPGAMDRLFFARDTLGYFTGNYSTITGSKLRGQYLHGLLAGLLTLDDLDPMLSSAVNLGELSSEEAEDLKKHIRLCTAQVPVSRWFDGSGKVINEADIILPGGQVRRPDRVVAWEDEVHIIDYKFGNDPDEPKHRRQVLGYINLLGQMGYQNIKGYLWYLDTDRVVDVNWEEER